MSKTCIIIAGPTAAGKTDISIELASHFKTEILSADSRQCFKELHNGVAKPTQEQLEKIPHHFIDSLSVSDNFSVAEYENYALDVLEKIFAKKDVAVVCGGTGLYIKALIHGLDGIPPIEEEIRQRIRERNASEGMEFAQKILREKDPSFAATEAIYNTNRVLRALEVLESTGKPISYFQAGKKHVRPFNFISICVEPDREVLYKSIDQRVLSMIEAGLVEEVRSLLQFANLNALNTVGYKEIFGYLKNESTLAYAIEKIQQNTRRYSKRQLTWFRHQGNFHFISPDAELIKNYILEKMDPL